MKKELDAFTEEFTEQERKERASVGACPVENDTISRVKKDIMRFSRKCSEHGRIAYGGLAEIAKRLNGRRSIPRVVEALKSYEPCPFDEIAYEDDIDDWNIGVVYARAFADRLLEIC